MFGLAACSTSHTPTTPNISIPIVAESAHPTESQVSQINPIGGWAPIFFVNFDQKQLDGIADGLNKGTIKRAVIVYPTKMQTLAGKIHDYLQTKTTQNLSMRSVELHDTDQVVYDLTQVIVTLYF